MSDIDFVKVTLPSRCLVYDGISPDEVRLRPFKGKDEKMVSEIVGGNFERKFIDVLRGVVEGIDVRKLTTGDRLFILIWEVINSYSENYFVEINCSFCGNQFSHNANLSNLDIVYLPEDFKEPYPIKLSNSRVNLRLFRVEDELAIEDFEKKGESSWLYRFARSIVDDEKDIMQKIAFLGDLRARDMAKIRAFHEKFFHGPNMVCVYECPVCKGGAEVNIPFRVDLFFPYGDALKGYFDNPM